MENDGLYATKEDCRKFVQNNGDFDSTSFYIIFVNLAGANKELDVEK